MTGHHKRNPPPSVVPGNEYWDLEGQRAIFDALPADRIGVRLLESLQMDPQKSQSALVPFGEALRILDDPGRSGVFAMQQM